MRWVDFMIALPGPLVAIVVVGVVGGGYWTAVLVLIILFTAPDTRIVRSAVLEQRPLPYIDAARALGVSKTRILFVHILPNVLPLVLAYVLLDFAFALVNLAGLSFLGLGVEPGTPDWGRMLFENRTILFSNPVGAAAAGGDDHPDRGQHEPDRRLAVRAADPVSAEPNAAVASAASLRPQPVDRRRRRRRADHHDRHRPRPRARRGDRHRRRIRLRQIADGEGDRPAAAAECLRRPARSASTAST